MKRLDKYLADLGIGTRSEVKDIIKKGRVTINGVVAKDSALKVNEDTDDIRVDGGKTEYEKNRYFMLSKPSGCVTATRDGLSETVIELLKNENTKNLFPVGRLDKDTEGLLLITDDGQLAHELLSPKKHVEKVYLARVSEIIEDEKLILFEKGMDIGDDKPCLPAKIEYIGDMTYSITLKEGRYHQVKRMVELAGSEVVYLKRISMGPLVLDENLKPGEYRRLTEEEINQIKTRK